MSLKPPPNPHEGKLRALPLGNQRVWTVICPGCGIRLGYAYTKDQAAEHAYQHAQAGVRLPWD